MVKSKSKPLIRPSKTTALVAKLNRMPKTLIHRKVMETRTAQTSIALTILKVMTMTKYLTLIK